MRKAILFAAALLTLPVLPAVAADNGFYLGGSIGQANLKIDDVTDGLTVTDFDGDDTAFKLIAGIRPLDWLGVEAAYVNFGEPEDTVFGQNVKADGDGISAFAVGFLPTGPVDLFAKLGLISWDSKISGTFDDDGTDLAYGVGAQFRVLGLSIRCEALIPAPLLSMCNGGAGCGAIARFQRDLAATLRPFAASRSSD
jgi:Outer membrane protein beta-barrel domain